MINDDAIKVFRALGDKNRFDIVMLLKDGEKNAGALLESLSFSQPTLSHHMKILCDSGAVDSRKVGKCVFYSISKECMKTASAFLVNIDKA